MISYDGIQIEGSSLVRACLRYQYLLVWSAHPHNIWHIVYHIVKYNFECGKGCVTTKSSKDLEGFSVLSKVHGILRCLLTVASPFPKVQWNGERCYVALMRITTLRGMGAGDIGDSEEATPDIELCVYCKDHILRQCRQFSQCLSYATPIRQSFSTYVESLALIQEWWMGTAPPMYTLMSESSFRQPFHVG